MRPRRTPPSRPAAERPVAARRWLRHLAHHLPVAIEGADDEGVHQVRVAAGRLAVWLELGGRSVLRDDLRALRRAAASVRDCDVLLARRVPAVFAARLRDRRDAARAEMCGVLGGPHARALRSALGRLPPVPRDDARAALRRMRDRVLRRGDALADAAAPHDEDFHALRRAVRKLRYALDWLGGDTTALKELQQVFGDLNDAAVEIRMLEETGCAELAPAHTRDLRAAIESHRRGALAAWRTSRAGIAATEAP